MSDMRNLFFFAYIELEYIHEWKVDMDKYHICGGNTLCGEIDVQGSKNGALPILAATVLISGRTVLKNCPMISDVEHMLKLLEIAGCRVLITRQTVEVDARVIHTSVFDGEHANAMRSSVVLLGAFLGRTGEISICYPGGCTIGKRPIDIHIYALTKMGCAFEKTDNCICGKAEKKEDNTYIHLPFPSVGATENVIMYGVLLEGVVQVYGCAKEPEIVELCNFLNRAGAKIAGGGTDVITIKGVRKLHEVCYRIMPDRIVAGTYLLAGAMTRGLVVLNHVPVEQMKIVFDILQKMGADLAIAQDWVCLNGENANRCIRSVATDVYPGFPTDLQSALMTALCIADGCSMIEESIFENRFQIVPYLQKMGADIHVSERRAFICGVPHLTGEWVKAEELRGGAALILAGLTAEGKTTVEDYGYIRRGYENICRDLKLLGAKIDRE